MAALHRQDRLAWYRRMAEIRRLTHPKVLSPSYSAMPERVHARMVQPINPKGTHFKSIVFDTASLSAPLIGTSAGEVMVLDCTGTEANWKTIANVVLPEDKVLVPVNGEFSGRIANICEQIGAVVIRLLLPWGQPIDPMAVVAALDAHLDVRVLCLVDVESSTAVRNPIADIVTEARCWNPDLLVVLDAISAVGAQAVDMDAAGVDVGVGVPGKAFAGPTGMAFVAIGLDRGWPAVARVRAIRQTVGFWEIRAAQREGLTLSTPNIPGRLGFHEALLMLHEEGLSARFARTAALAREAREIFHGRGFTLAAPEQVLGEGLTTFWLPDPDLLDADSAQIVERVERLGYVIGTGRGEWAPSSVRVAHWAFIEKEDLVGAADALVRALAPERPSPRGRRGWKVIHNHFTSFPPRDRGLA